jgi:hypothetical protein
LAAFVWLDKPEWIPAHDDRRHWEAKNGAGQEKGADGHPVADHGEAARDDSPMRPADVRLEAAKNVKDTVVTAKPPMMAPELGLGHEYGPLGDAPVFYQGPGDHEELDGHEG